MYFLWSYEHLKFDLRRVQISMLKKGKWLILVYFFKKIGEIVNRFFLNLYIIKILGSSIEIVCKNYRFKCKMFKTIIYWQFCYTFFVNIGFLSISIIIND